MAIVTGMAYMCIGVKTSAKRENRGSGGVAPSGVQGRSPWAQVCSYRFVVGFGVYVYYMIVVVVIVWMIGVCWGRHCVSGRRCAFI